jgi:hypothetical protein
MRRLAAAAPLCLALGGSLALGGCLAPHHGDLGRPAPSVWNSAILPYAGGWSAWARGEQVSPFHHTDDEIELRNRAWRFIMPAHELQWFERELQELVRTRILPVSWQSDDIESYRHALLARPFRSEYSRYRRLAEDALADAALVHPFRVMALRVRQGDAARMEAAERSPEVHPPMPEHAQARVAENDGMIAWVRERLRYRLSVYRSALANLVVELPSPEAVAAERAIAQLEHELKLMEDLAPTSYRIRRGETVRVRG